jgi:hypothetical protein
MDQPQDYSGGLFTPEGSESAQSRNRGTRSKTGGQQARLQTNGYIPILPT